MNTSRQLLIPASFSLLLVACVTGPQGWTERQRDWFYNTSQGSRLIRYSWMIALEQPDTTELFLSDKHIDGLRFLQQQNKLTPQNVMQLVNQPTSVPWTANTGLIR